MLTRPILAFALLTFMPLKIGAAELPTAFRSTWR